jgi:hypothetical protein
MYHQTIADLAAAGEREVGVAIEAAGIAGAGTVMKHPKQRNENTAVGHRRRVIERR